MTDIYMIDDKKYEEDIEAAKEREQQRLEDIKANPVKYMALSGIHKRYQTATLEGIKLPTRIIKAANLFIEGNSDGLFLTGVVGSGKTYLACAVARELILKGQYVYFISVPQIFQDIRATFRSNHGGEERIIKELSECDVLILDDLGTEKVSDFTLDRLYLIIDYRYSEIKKTIITSNLELDVIRTRIHDRLASRISEMCEIITMPKKDLRVER